MLVFHWRAKATFMSFLHVEEQDEMHIVDLFVASKASLQTTPHDPEVICKARFQRHRVGVVAQSDTVVRGEMQELRS